jgi:hypothetical protein
MLRPALGGGDEGDEDVHWDLAVAEQLAEDEFGWLIGAVGLLVGGSPVGEGKEVLGL